MMINSETKIYSILDAHPDALEAIVSISPRFNKLRNPVLRALMAPRASVGMASKAGNCSPEDFYKKLEPLGFVIDRIPQHMLPTDVGIRESSDWDETLSLYTDKTVMIDVRALEMPQPMLS